MINHYGSAKLNGLVNIMDGGARKSGGGGAGGL